MRSAVRLAAVAVLAVTLLALLAPAAQAHAEYLGSRPGKGQRLATAPGFVEVTLTERPDPDGSTLEVLDADGARVDLDDLSVDSERRMRASLRPDLADGAYRIRWSTISQDDGHVSSGTVGFAVGDFAPPDSQASDLDEVSWIGAGGRFLAFLGLALALGAGLFLVWVPGSVAVPRRPVLEALLAGTALHLAGVGFLLKGTLDQTSLGLSGLAATSIGEALLLRLGLGLGALAFAAIAIAPRVPARLPPHVAILLVAGAGLGSARFGHASLAGLGGIVLDAMHLLAAAGWVGGLLVYLWLLVESGRAGWGADQVRVAGVRFGTAAMASVGVLWLAGLGASVAILGRDLLGDPAVVASTWGRVLAGKTLLTVAMLAIAAVNRHGILEAPTEAGLAGRIQRWLGRVAPSLRSLEPRGGGLRRLLRVEAALGVAVLLLAGVLTSISPPSTASDGAAEASLELTGYGAEFHGEMRIEPAPRVGGSSSVTVQLATHAGTPIEGNTCGREPPLSCVSLTVGGDGGEVHALQPLGGGAWRVDGILWTAAGATTLTVRVSTSDVPPPGDAMAFEAYVAP